MEFFRHCPQCGRRFHIKLETRRVRTVDREQVPGLEEHYGARGGNYYYLSETRPVTIDREELEYTFKCGHCGHEWTEKSVKEVEEDQYGEPKQATSADVEREDLLAKEEEHAGE